MHVQSETRAIALQIGKYGGLAQDSFGMHEIAHGKPVAPADIEIAAHCALAVRPIARPRGLRVRGGKRGLAIHREQDIDFFHRRLF